MVKLMLAARLRTLPSTKATVIAECGVLGVAQLQIVGSEAAPESLGETWKGTLLAVTGFAGCPGNAVSVMPGVLNHGAFGGLGSGFGELRNTPQYPQSPLQIW